MKNRQGSRLRIYAAFRSKIRLWFQGRRGGRAKTLVNARFRRRMPVRDEKFSLSVGFRQGLSSERDTKLPHSVPQCSRVDSQQLGSAAFPSYLSSRELEDLSYVPGRGLIQVHRIWIGVLRHLLVQFSFYGYVQHLEADHPVPA